MAIKFPRHDETVRPLPDTRVGGLEFPRVYGFPETPGTNASHELTRRLTGQIPGVAENVSGIDVDAAAPPDIVPPARQTDQSRRYEVFTAAAGYATTAQYGNTGALAAGAKATFRASFIPDFWRVTTFGTGASDYVMVDVDSYGGGGAMALCLPRSAQTYPARGYDITVVANAANTGPLTVTVEAFAGVKTEGD